MEAHSQEKMAAASRSALEAAAETAKTSAAAEAERIEMAAAHEKVLQEIGEQLQARIKVRAKSQLGMPSQHFPAGATLTPLRFRASVKSSPFFCDPEGARSLLLSMTHKSSLP